MQPIMLLHGAIGSVVQLARIADGLQQHFKVYTLNFAGHGGRQIPETPLSIELFAGEVIRFMAAEGLEKINVFGYSMGGYVGMYLAKHFPEKLSCLITLATKFEWDEAIAAYEVRKLDPEKTELKVPEFAESLRQLHVPGDWKKLMVKTAEMMTDMGVQNPIVPVDYKTINLPVMLLLGDRDKMVTLEETLEVYKLLPNARMAILPFTGHSVEQVDAETIALLVRKFIKKN